LHLSTLTLLQDTETDRDLAYYIVFFLDQNDLCQVTTSRHVLVGESRRGQDCSSSL